MRKVFRGEIFAEHINLHWKKVWELYQLCNQFQKVNVELIAVRRKAGLLSQLRRPTGLVRSRRRTLTPNSTDIGQTSGRKLNGEIVATERWDVLKDLTVLEFSTLQSSWAHSRSPPTSPALLLRFGNNYRMIAMFRPAKRKSNSRWQGIWP